MRYRLLALSGVLAAMCGGCVEQSAWVDLVGGPGALIASTPAGKPVLEEPTLRCLGAYCVFRLFVL